MYSCIIYQWCNRLLIQTLIIRRHGLLEVFNQQQMETLSLNKMKLDSFSFMINSNDLLLSVPHKG